MTLWTAVAIASALGSEKAEATGQTDNQPKAVQPKSIDAEKQEHPVFKEICKAYSHKVRWTPAVENLVATRLQTVATVPEIVASLDNKQYDLGFRVQLLDKIIAEARKRPALVEVLIRSMDDTPRENVLLSSVPSLLAQVGPEALEPTMKAFLDHKRTNNDLEKTVMKMFLRSDASPEILRALSPAFLRISAPLSLSPLETKKKTHIAPWDITNRLTPVLLRAPAPPGSKEYKQQEEVRGRLISACSWNMRYGFPLLEKAIDRPAPIPQTVCTRIEGMIKKAGKELIPLCDPADTTFRTVAGKRQKFVTGRLKRMIQKFIDHPDLNTQGVRLNIWLDRVIAERIKDAEKARQELPR